MTFPTDYTLYDAITIDHTHIGTDGTTNQTIYLPYSLCSTQAQSTMRTDGGDARFTLSDGSTQLPRQVMRDNTGNRVGFRINIPTLSDTMDTVIRCYYNGTDTEPDAASTYGSQNANHTNTLAYYDMNQNPENTAPQITDQSVNARHGTCLGTMTSADSGTGLIGYALDFDGTDDAIHCGTSVIQAAQLNSAFHIRFWAKTTSTGSFLRPFGNWWINGSQDQGLWCSLNGTSDTQADGSVALNIRSANTAGKLLQAYTTIGASVYDGNWHCYDLVCDVSAGQIKIYFDGAAQSVTYFQQATFTDMANMTTQWIIGASEYSNTIYDPFNGQLDSFAIYTGTPTQASITTHINNITQSATFFSDITAGQITTNPGTSRSFPVIGSDIIRSYR